MSINRAFIYGDLLFETIAVRNNRIANGMLHFERLTAGANQLNFELPQQWDYQYFVNMIQTHITSSNQRIRFVMHRNASGFYYPQNNIVKCVVEVWPMPLAICSIKNIELYEQEFKACTPLSNLKSGNALLYVMAAQYAQQHGLDDVFVLNQHGHIAEASSSNVFIRKNNKLYTPPLTEAPVNGIVRKLLLLQSELDYEVFEKAITVDDLLDADECFLTNTIHGVVSVDSFRRKQYDNKAATYLQQVLSAINE